MEKNMTIEELRKIRDEQSAKIIMMSPEERKQYYTENRERLINRVGKDYFIPTEKPNIWKHIAKKNT